MPPPFDLLTRLLMRSAVHGSFERSDKDDRVATLSNALFGPTEASLTRVAVLMVGVRNDADCCSVAFSHVQLEP